MAETGTKRGGYRPGAGRPKTTLKAWCDPGVVLEVERRAGLMGVTPEQLAGYLLKQATESRLWPVTVREVEAASYTGRDK